MKTLISRLIHCAIASLVFVLTFQACWAQEAPSRRLFGLIASPQLAHGLRIQGMCLSGAMARLSHDPLLVVYGLGLPNKHSTLCALHTPGAIHRCQDGTDSDQLHRRQIHGRSNREATSLP